MLAYGLKSAVQIVTRLILPIKAYIHTLGIRFNIFIDDGILFGQQQAVLAVQAQVVLQIFQMAGWSIQWAKTNVQPTRQLLCQGFVIDTEQMRFFTPTPKILILIELLSRLIESVPVAEALPNKLVALVLGKIVSMVRSHGSITSVLSRATQHLLGCSVHKFGWHGFVHLDTACSRELQMLRDAMYMYNGQFIKHAYTGASVDVNAVSRYCELVRNTESHLLNLFVSDASDSAAFVYKADGTFEYVQEFVFSTEQAGLGSGLRELLAVLYALRQDAAYFQQYKGQIVYWQTDSQNCYGFLWRGSRKVYIQDVVREIKLLENNLGITLVPVWTPRSHERIVIADIGSKFSLNSDEWSIDRIYLQILLEELQFQPHVDCFVAHYNYVCSLYFSRGFDAGSAGINFFVQPLYKNVHYFCCPPVALIVPCFKRLTAQPGLSFLLIVPEWHSAGFWPILFPRDSTAFQFQRVVRFYAPFFYGNAGRSTVFSAAPNFYMLACLYHAV